MNLERRSTKPSARPPRPETTRGTRRTRRKLLALESVQIALGIGILVLVALRAIVTIEDDAVASALTIGGMFVMVLVVVALRVRFGRETLRREVKALEDRRALEDLQASDRAPDSGRRLRAAARPSTDTRGRNGIPSGRA